MRKTLYSAIAASLLASTAFADVDLVDWDSDNDGVISSAEYRDHMSEHDVIGRYDHDDDDLIDTTEWTKFTDDADDEFDLYDDHDWDEEYQAWDVDNDRQVSESEFNDGLFAMFDENDNGIWEEEEWEDFDDSEWWEI